eukprot:CAMPEP_0177742994 /NCGR_PEP_ID=MMETSP0484_2-20121128/28961_1 /TAXON_ID=354590 /ORGANISM="Rhodomonas lens, Strain RHODO" /LENGTH=31 /DNA_ID= /DNA_START= /DNA_END= /DNA_ORIENTATION=
MRGSRPVDGALKELALHLVDKLNRDKLPIRL